MFFLLGSVLKAGGFRRGGTKRKSGRNKRWSRASQVALMSWAIVGQLGSVGVLLQHLDVKPAFADTIPNSYGGSPTGVGASKNEPNAFNSRGSMAIGFAASAGYETDNLDNSKGIANGSSIAIGTLSNASQYGSVAIGIGAVTTRENQIVLGASTTLDNGGFVFATENATTVTVPNLYGSGSALVAANEDGTLYRYEGAGGGGLDNLGCVGD